MSHLTTGTPLGVAVDGINALLADYRSIAERNRRQANKRLTGADAETAATRYALTPETVRAAVYSKVVADLENLRGRMLEAGMLEAQP